MDCYQSVVCLRGLLCHSLLLFIIWVSSFQEVAALETLIDQRRVSLRIELADPPFTGLFDPIQISPAVIPSYPNPIESLPPMYPTFPKTYEPNLTGRCPVNISALSSILEKTASDCSQPLAALVGNVICCPQLGSLLHIFQSYHNSNSDDLVLQIAVANDCFSDIISILASKGANSTLPMLCSVKPSNLTGGSCPVKDTSTFEKLINTSRLLEACGAVDQLKECCRPVCQPEIMKAAMLISGNQMTISDNKKVFGDFTHLDAINDCKAVVYSYLSRKLPEDDANNAFRILSSCKVNKVCPLEFKQPSEVIKACRNVAAPSPSCCSSLNTYIAGIQKQMLITNKQAIICAMDFGSMLRKGGVMTNIYELCDVDLKDFSIQAYGQQGCLLRSLPADVVLDNATGFYSFTCDLTDNIAAPWPSSSSVSSLTLCAGGNVCEMSTFLHHHICLLKRIEKSEVRTLGSATTKFPSSVIPPLISSWQLFCRNGIACITIISDTDEYRESYSFIGNLCSNFFNFCFQHLKLNWNQLLLWLEAARAGFHIERGFWVI